MRTPVLTSLLVAGLLLSACGPTAGDDERPVAAPVQGRELEEEPVAEPSDPLAPLEALDPIDPEDLPSPLDTQVDEAIEHARDSGGTDITLTVAEATVWSDGSLGCPEPGMMYTQALVEGYRIVLDVDGREVAYHGATGQSPGRCDQPS